MANIIAELAKTMAISGARYICCFMCIVEDFEKEIEYLKEKMEIMEHRIEVAKRRGENISIEVIDWIKQTHKLIEEDTKTKMIFFRCCPNCIGRYLRGKKLSYMTKEIRRLVEFNIHESFVLTSGLPGVEYNSSQYYVSLESRKVKHKELIDALEDVDTYIIGLQGMAGTGKTTLAKKVGNELKEWKQFDYVIHTTVSYTPEIKKIQDDIGAPLGLRWDDCSESERSKKLWSRLTNGEKTLIILDDVWGGMNFEEIGIPYGDNHKCCKILLTMRDLRVCKSIGCERIIHLDLLSDEEAWILFKKYACISDSSPKSILDMGIKISQSCKGLPIAITAIATSLKGQHSHAEWKSALASLINPLPMLGVDETMIEVYKCLRYSYDNMKNDKAKKLFLLCSIFQEDEEIDYEILNRLAIGVGIFGEVYEKYDEARTQAVVVKNILIDSSLLKDEEDHVKMTDFARNVGMWIAEKMIQSINLSNKNQNSLYGKEKNIKYLLCEGKHMDVFSCRFDGSRLEILIVKLHNEEAHSIQVPDSFVENMTSLRVFHLSTKGGIQLSLSLPNLKLTCIRSLILESLDLGDISMLGTLRTLETLDLIECSIMELAPEITTLEKLKLLKLYECSITRKSNPFEVIARCSSLEELYFEDVDVDYLLINGDKAAELTHQNTTFPALRKFRLIANVGIKPKYSRCVCLPDVEGLISEAAMRYLIQRAEVLKLEATKTEWRNVMPDMVPMDEGTNDLCKLYLESCQNLQHLIDTTHADYSDLQNLFSKLVTLEFEEMNNLKELCNGILPFNFFKSLKRLYIYSCENLRSISLNSKINFCSLTIMILSECPMLESLFLLATCRSLMMLKYLKINYCGNLKNIIKVERIGNETKDEIVDADYVEKSCGVLFSNLRSLHIEHCDRLEFILPFLSSGDVPLLETIIIRYCGELKFIFGLYQHEQKVNDVVLGSLKNVILNEVPNFIDIFPEESTSSMKWSSAEECTSLTSTTTTNISLASMNQQQQDNSISSVSNSGSIIHLWEHGHRLSKQLQMLCNVKKIDLSNLSKRKSIFILSLTPTSVLETLTIKNCEELKQIVIGKKDNRNPNNWGDVFPRLKHIYVQNCRQLEYIFGEYHDDYNNHNDILLHLPALESMELDNLPNLINICSKMYSISFPLKTLKMRHFSQFKSIGHMIVHLESRHIDSTTVKDLRDYLGENLKPLGSILSLWKIYLFDLPHMTNLFVGGPKASFILQNLKELTIHGCETLEVVFPVSILKCFPQLQHMSIKECKKLKQIIEEDVENKEIMSNIVSSITCFPKLTKLEVEKCNELKYVLHVSASKEFPKLKYLKITEASKLEEVFRCEHENHKVKLPNLKYVLFVDLPNISQEIELQTPEGRLVRNCPKLSPTSTSILDRMRGILHADREIDADLEKAFRDTIDVLQEEYSNTKDTRNENPSAKTTKDFAPPAELEIITNEIESNDFNSVVTEMKPTLSREILTTDPELIIPLRKTESHESLDHQSMGEQCEMKQQSFGETNITLKSPHKTNIPDKTEDHNVKEGSTSMTKENGDGQKTISSFPVATAEHPTIKDVGVEDSLETSNFSVALTKTRSIDDDASGKVNLTVGEQFSYGDGVGVSESKPASNAFQSPSTYNLSSKGDHNAKEDSTALTKVTTISSTDSETGTATLVPLQQENGDGQKTMSSASTVEHPTIKDIGAKDSLETSNFSVALNKNRSIGVSESKSSSDAFQSPSMATYNLSSKGNHSQIEENFILATPIIRELEQLVSNKYLAEENYPLLTDFIVKHPTVCLVENARRLTTEYKGFAYSRLAKLLKFLQTHSALDVLESSHSDFVGLLEDLRNLPFDKEWLDVVERRALSPNLPISPNAWQELLQSKQHATEKVEKLRLKVEVFTQHVEDLKHQLASSEAVLESIIQQEAQVLQARADLSVPLGY